MEKQLKVLITAAAGRSGTAAVDELLKMGNPVRALVRSADERSEQLARKGVEVVVGDLLNFDDLAGALNGVDTAYFCFPILTHGLLQSAAYFAQAAKEAGLKGIVNMSQATARRDARSHAAQDHWISEQIFDMTGIPSVHLRPPFFYDWFLYINEVIQGMNAVILPFGNGRWAPVDTYDLGRAVAHIAATPERYAGKILKLSGPQEYDLYEVTEILSQVLGREITYQAVSIEQFNQILAERGANEHFIQHMTYVAQDCIEGRLAGTNNILETILGGKPTTIREFFGRNRKAF